MRISLVVSFLRALSKRIFVALAVAAGSYALAIASEDSNSVVATQGGASVTFGDIDKFASTIPAGDRDHFFDDPNRIQSVISGMLLQKQLAMEAVAAGLDKTSDIANAEASKKESALAKAEMDRFRADIKIPDMSVLAKEEYVGHPENYVIPGRTIIKDIFISNESRDAAAAKELASKISDQARADPSKFDSLIEKSSDDPKKEKSHGVLTIVKNTNVDQLLVAAADQLPLPGSISSPIEVVKGYHVIMLVERLPDKQKKFEEVRDQIVVSLKSKFFDDKVREHTDTLRNKPIQANREFVASLRDRYAKVSADAHGKQPNLPGSDKADAKQ